MTLHFTGIFPKRVFTFRSKRLSIFFSLNNIRERNYKDLSLRTLHDAWRQPTRYKFLSWLSRLALSSVRRSVREKIERESCALLLLLSMEGLTWVRKLFRLTASVYERRAIAQARSSLFTFFPLFYCSLEFSNRTVRLTIQNWNWN